MKKSDSLTNLSLYYLIGNLFSKLFSFVLIFLVTHSLSKEDIGEYDLIFTALSFITPVISLQIGTSVLRWLLASSSEEESSDVVRTGFFILLLGCSVYTVVFLFSMIFISFRNAAFLYMISVLQVVFYTLQQTVRGLGRNFLFTFSGVVNTLLFVVFSFLSLYVLQLGLSGLLAASVASLAISIAVVFFGGNLSFCFHRHFNFSLAKRMIAYSLPLLPNAISWWLITSATRFIILYYLGVEANAVFAISFRFPMLVMFLTDIFYLAWQEKAIKSATDNTANYSGVLKKYLSLILSIIILLSGVSKLVIELLADKSYSGSWPIVPILLYAVALQALSGFYGAAYLASNETKKAFLSTMYGGLVTVLAAAVTTPFFGLFAVSFSILIGFLVVLVIRVRSTKGFFNFSFPLRSFVMFTGLFGVVNILNYANDPVWLACSILISLLVFAVFSREHFLPYILTRKLIPSK